MTHVAKVVARAILNAGSMLFSDRPLRQRGVRCGFEWHVPLNDTGRKR